MKREGFGEGNISLGLICSSCGAYAVIVGFRDIAEAYSFARHQMGWDVGVVPGAEGTFCPACRVSSGMLPPTRSYADGKVYGRVTRAVQRGEEIACTVEEWPQIRDALREYTRHCLENTMLAMAMLAQQEEERLALLFGEGESQGAPFG